MLTLLRKLARVDGAEIAEAALVLPLVFMFLLGIVWFGRAFQIYSTLTQAAQRAATTAARPACATCTAPGDVWPGTTFPGNTTVQNSVYSVTDASGLSRTDITPNPPAVLPAICPQPPAPIAGACSPSVSGVSISICRSVWLNNPSTPAQCGVIVGMKYPFQFYLPFTSLNLQQITLKAEAQSRMEF